MPILLLPIFLFGVVISWIVFLGLQEAKDCTRRLQRARAGDDGFMRPPHDQPRSALDRRL